MRPLYKPPVSYKKVLYYMFYILAWIGVVIGILDLYIAFARKSFSFNNFTGFILAGLFFVLSILTKKRKTK